MSTWGEIARRCQEASAEGLDDEAVGHAIAMAHGGKLGWTEVATGDDGSDELQVYTNNLTWSAYRDQCPDLSVDAALRLVAKKLPDRPWKLMTDEGRFDAMVDMQEPDNYCASPALALLAAFSLAMEAKEASQGKEGESHGA